MSFESFILSAGIIGQIIFFFRFIVLRYFPAKEGQSVIPLSFWYMSLLGSSMVLCYAVAVRDPVFIAVQGAALVLYLQNLYSTASERGMNKFFFLKASFILLCINIYLVSVLLFFAPAVERSGADGEYVLLYYALGFSGLMFFFFRFFVQWFCTEKLYKSLSAVSFWYFGLLGSALLFVYALLVQDTVFIIGQSVCLLTYAGNLYYVLKERAGALA